MAPKRRSLALRVLVAGCGDGDLAGDDPAPTRGSSWTLP